MKQPKAGGDASHPSHRDDVPSYRDDVRALIRAEIARLDPVAASRTALEMIAETSVVWADNAEEALDGPETRVATDDGRVLSLRELAAEVRDRHPLLFKPAGPGKPPKASARARAAKGAPEPSPPKRAADLRRAAGKAREHLADALCAMRFGVKDRAESARDRLAEAVRERRPVLAVAAGVIAAAGFGGWYVQGRAAAPAQTQASKAASAPQRTAAPTASAKREPTRAESAAFSTAFDPPKAPQGAVQVAALGPVAVPAKPAGWQAFTLQRDCASCPELVVLPGGAFQMGSAEDASEKPVRQVTVRGFAMGRFAVTTGEWKSCVAAKACPPAGDDADDRPVRNVSFADAQAYVAWLSLTTNQTYRLPTEAEWEYAARGGTQSRYYWGNQVALKVASCKGCGEDLREPLAVGSFPANPFGLHDMAGGVDQWVQDCWVKNYADAPRDGSARETSSCRQRVLRGGSWRSGPDGIRSAARNFYDVGVRHPNHGFRVVRVD